MEFLAQGNNIMTGTPNHQIHLKPDNLTTTPSCLQERRLEPANSTQISVSPGLEVRLVELSSAFTTVQTLSSFLNYCFRCLWSNGFYLTFFLQIFYIRLRNLWLPLFLNCWLAKSALDTMLVSILFFLLELFVIGSGTSWRD